MDAFGGIVTILIKGGEDASRKMLEKHHIFALAESLDGIESLVKHPAIMTHASAPYDERQNIGIYDNLLRLSVGIDDYKGLKPDLNYALG